jgi:hypothetical protein
VIMGELGDKYFSILTDESRDISVKEQMTVMLRLVLTSNVFPFSLFCMHLKLFHVVIVGMSIIKERLWNDFLHYNMSLIPHPNN